MRSANGVSMLSFSSLKHQMQKRDKCLLKKNKIKIHNVTVLLYRFLFRESVQRWGGGHNNRNTCNLMQSHKTSRSTLSL